jgi:hypothetical protein
MPFSIRPYQRFPVQCTVTYNAGPFLKLLRASCLGFGSLITLLVLSSGPAYAEWVEVGVNDSSTQYVDLDTIRRKGNLMKMWNLFDYKAIHTYADKPSWSVKGQSEYNCAEEQLRYLAVYA